MFIFRGQHLIFRQTAIEQREALLRILRGYASAAFFGEAYVLGTFEYRLPLIEVEAGAWTLPLYLRRPKLRDAIWTT